jgi:hypothetical protein
MFLLGAGITPVMAQGFSDVQILQYPAGARFITTIGTGLVHAAPNKVLIMLGVENWGKDVNAANAQNDLACKKIIALAPKYHIESKDVQTSQINVNPTYPETNDGGYGQTSRKPNGYKVEKSITFTLKEISSLAALITDALDAGANNVSSIRFDTTETRRLKDEARVLAVNAAKEKAQAMATQLNSKLGKALIVKEMGGDQIYPQPMKMMANACMGAVNSSDGGDSIELTD